MSSIVMLCIVILFVISSFSQSAPLTTHAARRSQRDLPWHRWVCGCLSSPDQRSVRCHRMRWTLCSGGDDTPCKMDVLIKNIPRSNCSDSEIITSWSSTEGKFYMQVLNYLAGKNSLKITKLYYLNGTRELSSKSVLDMSQEWILRGEKPLRKATTATLTTTVATASRSAFRTNPSRVTQAQTKLSQSTKSSTTTAHQSTASADWSDSFRAARLYPLGCGRRDPFTFKIVNGISASEYAWPWHVALTTDMDTTCTQKNEDRSTFCGGTLIHPWFVLTAAHCVTQKRFMVVAGDYDRKDCRNREVYASPANITPYSRNRNAHDVALIQLSNPVQNSNGVEFACVPPPRFKLPAGTKCMIYGWGKTSETARVGSSVINEAELELGHADSCSPAANDSQLCAGMLGNSNTDSCYGDSGGGLMCELKADAENEETYESEYDEESEDYDAELDEEQQEVKTSRWVLYGVTSRGRGCGREPAIYQLVSAYSEWIMKAIANFEEQRQRERTDAPLRRRSN